MIGTTISHYNVLEELGRGGMGVVYKAQDTKLDRVVALKFLPHQITRNETEKMRFLQEARAAAALNHPNICSIYSIHEEGDQQFIELEYVDGETLRRKLENGPLKLDEAIAFGIEIAEALQEAHAKGIVHRDIKADNIMVNSRSQIKVMDFGLAKLKGVLKLTLTSSTVGTLGYMAPEQLRGEDVDHRGDIFSFGVVLFELLAGRIPFRGEHEAALMYSVVNEEPESLTKYIPDVSPELLHIVSTSLEKDPQDRYQSASEIIRDLRRIKKQTSRVMRASVKAPSVGAGDQAAPVSRTESATGTGRKSWTGILVPALLVAGLVAIAFIVYTLVGSDEEPAPFQRIAFSRVTSSGKVGYPASISPDGKYIVYVERDRGMKSLWMRQKATTSSIQILPPVAGNFLGITFSHDGNFVYYTLKEDLAAHSVLYRLPVLGGTPTRILTDVQSGITFSPDEKQFAFFRVTQSTGDFGIFTAALDGSRETRLASYKGDLWYVGAQSWSPKEEIIAAGRGSWEGGFHHALREVSVRDGKDTPIGTQQWNNIQLVDWTSDGKGLVLLARDRGSSVHQVWYVAYPSGESRRLTNDLNDYFGLSVTSDNKTICVAQGEAQTEISLVPLTDKSQPRVLVTGPDDGMSGLAVAPDGRIYFTSSAGGTPDIWVMETDGSRRTQVTSDPDLEQHVSVAPGGKYIVYSSSRGGTPSIWRANPNGTNALQLTSGSEDYTPGVSPDGHWVVFSSWIRGPITIMKVGVEGGERIDLTTTNGFSPVIAPDGSRVAFIRKDEQRNVMTVQTISLEGGTAEYAFDLPPNWTDRAGGVRWRPKTREISFLVTREDVSNIWTRSLDGGPSKQVTNFQDREIARFDWTPDGKSLVVTRVSYKGDVVLISEER